MKRIVLSLTVFKACIALSSTAFAVPAALKCPEGDPNAKDCIRDDVFIMDGTAPGLLTSGAKVPVNRRGCLSGSIPDQGLLRWNCFFDQTSVEKRFREILKAKNVQTPQWDELVIFSVDSDEPAVFGAPTEPMLFYRVGGSVNGVNEVEGIGLPKKDRDPAVPYAGYVTGGSSTTFGIWRPPFSGAVPPSVKWWPLPDPAGVPDQEVRYRNCGPNAYCNDGFTGYQALAQVSSHLFGPYLREEAELAAPNNWFAFSPKARSGCNPPDPPNGIAVPVSLAPNTGGSTDAGASDAGGATGPLPKFEIATGGLELLDLGQLSGTRTKPPNGDKLRFGEPALSVCPNNKTELVRTVSPPYVPYNPTTSMFGTPTAEPSNFTKLRPRIWNSFMDLDGSLMGGGSNWIENGNWTATSGGPNAFQIGSPPYRGRQMVVFHPLELWLMGFAPAEGIKVDTYNTKVQDILGPEAALGTFTSEAGPRMGLPILVAIGNGAKILTIFSNSRREPHTLTELLGTPPARNPDFATARHWMRQMWVVVTKPEDKIKATEDLTGKCQAATCDSGRLEQINADGIEHMIRWRRAWQQQFYLYTGYTGRMVTNFDQDFDDSAYWEFIQKVDDTKTFTPGGGLEFDVSGQRKDVTSAAILSYANISTPGRDGTMTFTTHSQQLPTRIDGRIKERAWGGSDRIGGGTPAEKKFVVAGDNALLVRMALPKKDPDEAKKLKAEATMQLANGPKIRIPGDKDSFLVFDGKFHTYAVDLRKEDGYVGNTFNGFTFTPSSVEVKCTPAITDDPAKEDLNCVKLDYIRFTNVSDPDDAGDFDKDCVGANKPDGYIGLEDNCPKLYNPGQEDADGNGVGDDCEDFDLDAIANRCDNCPTLTNSRQGDRDKNGVGDICDEEYRGGCFLQPDSVAGPKSNPAVIPLVLLGLSLAGVFAARMKRRRKR